MSAEPYRPSNGTEGDVFMTWACGRCERDKDFQDDPEEGIGCPIALAALAFSIDDPNFPKEWVRDPRAPTGGRCTAFVERGQAIPYRCQLTQDMFA